MEHRIDVRSEEPMKKIIAIVCVTFLMLCCIKMTLEQRSVAKKATLEKLFAENALLDAEHARSEAMAETEAMKLKFSIISENLNQIRSDNKQDRMRLEKRFEERFSELDRRLDSLGSKEERWHEEGKQLLLVGNQRLREMLKQTEKREAREGVILTTLKAVRFPPQPLGEKPVFEIVFESVGALKVKKEGEPSKPDHLGLYLTWAKEKPKPDATFLKQIASLYRLSGSNVTDDVLQLSPVGSDGIISDAKEGDTSTTWFVAFRYGEGKTPIPFMNVTVFPSRAHVLWYGGSGKPDVPHLEQMFRLPLLELARSLGIGTGNHSEWNPDAASELVFKP